MALKSSFIKARVTEVSKKKCDVILNKLNIDMSSFLRIALAALIENKCKFYFTKSSDAKSKMKEVLTRVDEQFKSKAQKALGDGNISAAVFFQTVINALISTCENRQDLELNGIDLQIKISEFGLISVELSRVSNELEGVVKVNISGVNNKTINKKIKNFQSIVDRVIEKNKKITDWPVRISFANQKGGVGKTTYNVQLSMLLGLLKYRVLYIDNDPQGNSSSILLHDKLSGENGKLGIRSAQVFDVNTLSLYDLTKTSYPNIDIIYANKNDSELTDREAMDISMITKQKDMIDLVKNEYDFIIVDCVPSLGRLLLSSLTISQHIISPLVLSGFAFDGVEGILNTILSLQDNLNPQLNYVCGFINNLNTESKIQMKIKDDVMRDYPELVIKTLVPNRPPLDSAIANNQSVLFERYSYVTTNNILDLYSEIFSKIENSYS